MKRVEYFICDFDMINETLVKLNLDADNIINILELQLSNGPYDVEQKGRVLVYFITSS